MPGRWGHLALRFIDVVTSRHLDDRQRQRVREWVSDPVPAAIFFDQSAADQRHGYDSALHVAAHTPRRPDLIRAALLHDVGKRHARLGAIGRSLASVAIRLGLQLRPRWALYRDHGMLAAAELADCEPIVSAFARHHHGSRPATIAPGDWTLLVAADSARVGR